MYVLGDYAWGPQGIDAVITQLLNQIDGVGPPPAPDDAIENLCSSKITQAQVDSALQCSVCFEDFKLDEDVKKLPCEHCFHKDCIVPWLKLHGTCPICRKPVVPTDEASQQETPENTGSFFDLLLSGITGRETSTASNRGTPSTQAEPSGSTQQGSRNSAASNNPDGAPQLDYIDEYD